MRMVIIPTIYFNIIYRMYQLLWLSITLYDLCQLKQLKMKKKMNDKPTYKEW